MICLKKSQLDMLLTADLHGYPGYSRLKMSLIQTDQRLALNVVDNISVQLDLVNLYLPRPNKSENDPHADMLA